MESDNPKWSFVGAVHYGKGRVVPITSGVDHYTGGGSGRALATWGAGRSVYRGKPVPAPKATGTLIVCRDGKVIQQVKLADRAYHAGTRFGRGDFWKGVEPQRNVNDFTVGIENSNYGWLIREKGIFYIPVKRDGIWVAGNRYPAKHPAPVEAKDHKGILRWWEPYAEELVEANIGVKKFLRDEGHVVCRTEWCGHSDVSPERKHDPGPLWPMDYILDEVFGTRKDAQ